MKIELGPDGVVMPVLARTTMAAGGTAGLRTEKFGVRGVGLRFLAVNPKRGAQGRNRANEFFCVA